MKFQFFWCDQFRVVECQCGFLVSLSAHDCRVAVVQGQRRLFLLQKSGEAALFFYLVGWLCSDLCEDCDTNCCIDMKHETHLEYETHLDCGQTCCMYSRSGGATRAFSLPRRLSTSTQCSSRVRCVSSVDGQQVDCIQENVYIFCYGVSFIDMIGNYCDNLFMCNNLCE